MKKEVILEVPDKVKILGINGSPRKAANTSEMVKFTLRAAESMGYVETEYLNLQDYHVSYCTDCKRCIGYNKPAEDPMMCYDDPADEAHKIHAKIEEADGVVLGYPVYRGHLPALVYTSEEKTYLPGSPFFNELDPHRGWWGGKYKPKAIIAQGGQQYAGQETSYYGPGALPGPLTVGAWPTAEDPEPQASWTGGMLSCVDGMSVYDKKAWTSGFSRVSPPTTGIRNERTLRNLGRWLAVTAMMMKLARIACQEAEMSAPLTQQFVRYAGGKPKPGSVIERLIKEGKVTYVSQEELTARKKIKA